MLQRGDPIPHFELRTLQGELIRYSTVWQHTNLVLIMLADAEADSGGRYVSELSARIPEFSDQNATCVVTRDPLPGISAPAVLVADKWGEIVHIAAKSAVADLPRPDELLDWVHYVQTRCPECEGEAK